MTTQLNALERLHKNELPKENTVKFCVHETIIKGWGKKVKEKDMGINSYCCASILNFLLS